MSSHVGVAVEQMQPGRVRKLPVESFEVSEARLRISQLAILLDESVENVRILIARLECLAQRVRRILWIAQGAISHAQVKVGSRRRRGFFKSSQRCFGLPRRKQGSTLLHGEGRIVRSHCEAAPDPGERGGSVLVLQQQSGEGREESGISPAGADDALIGCATILVGAAPILGLPHPGKRGIMLPAGTLIRGASVLNYGSSQDSEQSPSDLQSEELT